MPFVVRCFNKKTNTTYCYQCENFKDENTGEWKSRRRLIGKLGENGEIIPTGKRGRKPKPAKESNPEKCEAKTPSRKEIEREVREKLTSEFQVKIISLQEENISLKRDNERLYSVLSMVLRQLSGTSETIRDALSK